ncbi:MAG: fluoride efflux transporter CrcB [Ktedonobacteraceae bacterium]|nr:fluoride efflux transporter CrcB [Ktedonobacteraceae bacterium]
MSIFYAFGLYLLFEGEYQIGAQTMEEGEGARMTVQALALTGGVGVAGALGALARYLLGRWVARRVRSVFPYGTFIINLTGAFLIGILFALADQKVIIQPLQILLATGFLGGYTTFSTMSWEGVQLMRSGGSRPGLLYITGSLMLGLVAAAAGLALGRWL